MEKVAGRVRGHFSQTNKNDWYVQNDRRDKHDVSEKLNADIGSHFLTVDWRITSTSSDRNDASINYFVDVKEVAR